jgi:hypothetical protein
MSAIHQVLLAGGGANYQIANSLRFRAANSAYLSRTFGSPTSSTVWTFSAECKRGTLGSTSYLLGASTTTNFGFNSSNQLVLTLNGTTACTSTAVFRDPSAWMHIVYQQNGSAQTIYVNNASVATGTTAAAIFNTAIAHQVGAANTTNFFDGHLANVYWIDGQALTPSSFGQTEPTTGVWVPKAYSGTFGANGFFLEFKDAASTTTIGYDTSGNSNNFTTSGISVTAGATFDQMTDTPTNNYCVLSQINKSTSGGTVKNAGLTWNSGGGGATFYLVQSTFVLSGKCYWEFVVPASITFPRPGIMRADQSPPLSGASYWPGGGSGPANSVGYVCNDGDIYVGGVAVVTGATPSAGDIIMFAFDAASGELWVGRNGTWLNSGDPAAGTGEVTTVSLSYSWVATVCDASTQDADINFGQRAFSYTPPSGFKALSTANITSTAVSTSGSFTGNAAADGPFVWTNGNPATLTINGNGVTFGTDADKTAGGFKLRTASASYNASGSNTWTATAGKRFVQSKKPNNAQVNP